MIFKAKVASYNDITHQEETDNLILCAEAFIEAISYVDKYYGNDLTGVNLELLSPDNFVSIPDTEAYDKIVNDIADSAIW
jgi:hypothetical protein